LKGQINYLAPKQHMINRKTTASVDRPTGSRLNDPNRNIIAKSYQDIDGDFQPRIGANGVILPKIDIT